MKNKDKVLILIISLLVVSIFTWIVPSGQYNEYGELVSEINRIGIFDVMAFVPFAIRYVVYDIFYILVIGGFYGVLSKTKGYRSLISKTVKLIKGKQRESIALILSIFVIALLVSITGNILSVLWICPFIVTVFLKRGYDRLTALSAGFGGLFVGSIGSTYGTYGVSTVISIFGTTVTDGLMYKILLFVISFILFSFFAVLHMNKQEKVNETSYDLFTTAKLTEKEQKNKVLVWPTIVLLVVGVILSVIGYINWNTSFGVTVFDNLHEDLSSYVIGDLHFYSLFMGSQLTALGTWTDMIPLSLILIVISIILALVNKTSVSQYIENFGNGAKKMLRLAFVFTICYAILVVCGTFTWPVTILNNFISSGEFNMFNVLLLGIVGGLFFCDEGILGALFATYLSSVFANNLISTSIILHAGFSIVQVVAPTSLILLTILSYLDISYKDWMKYIWKYVLALLVCVILLFSIMCYM